MSMHKKGDPSLKSEDQRIKAVIIGAGNRSLIYASYALQHPDELQIVGVVEPSLERRQLTRTLWYFSGKLLCIR
ncbi:Gfo/Idh/MocA family oxidoreductase [Paenibacillus alginolyticus]|uniref:Gfo/Idh/MocA family oxidoreductase n=1 Tax=Paenibacillus alginolyticus TaxID=59839 RepID=UPI001FE3486A|nr:Gfo/Idh/MocA family oxidoreductase [Paenibacillus frigoriresistens]